MRVSIYRYGNNHVDAKIMCTMRLREVNILTAIKHILIKGGRAITDATLGQLEKRIVRQKGQPKYPPIFIIGHSRSGTTLLYQILCAHLELAYFANATVKFPAYPVLSTMFFRRLGVCDPDPCYESEYGITRGWNQPNSGYSLWKSWFGTGHGEMGIEPKNETAREEMIGTVSWISEMYDRPFINKWTPNSARLVELGRSFPEANFLLMRREFQNIAQSMLKARIEVKGDPKESFVTWPEEYESSDPVDYIHSVVEHIRLVENGILSSIDNIGADRFLRINYQDLCKSPLNILNLVRDFYRYRSDFVIMTRNIDVLPRCFPYSNSIKIEMDDYQKLATALSDISF